MKKNELAVAKTAGFSHSPILPFLAEHGPRAKVGKGIQVHADGPSRRDASLIAPRLRAIALRDPRAYPITHRTMTIVLLNSFSPSRTRQK